MKRTRTVSIAAVIAVLCAVVAWQFAREALNSIRISLANEQTAVFSEMVMKASDALNQQPPNVKAAVGFLEYTHSYYPSGTKQTVGSTLDRMVERSRSLAESQIIEMLRDVTGADHGTNAEEWILELRNQEGFDERS